MDQNVAVVMVPLPAQGHLNQLLHLSRLISNYHIPVHFVSTSTHIRQANSRVQGWDPSTTPNLHFHHLQTPLFTNPQPDPNSTNKFPAQILPLLNASAELREPVHRVVQQLATTSRRVVIIYDSLMACVVQDSRLTPNVESYCFQSVSAFSLYSFYWEHEGKPNISSDEGAMMVKMVPSMEGCFVSEFFEIAKRRTDIPHFHSGDLYNTSRVVEGLYLDLLAKEKKTGTHNNWALGPFHPLLPKHDGAEHWCLEWLEQQEENSVMYVSFGSSVSLSDEQISEVAIGLERSGHKFLWVLRDADKGDIYEGEVRTADLPQGFEERVEGRGVVVRDWAPQLEILRHPSTGGFMSHCGWNSCIESISMGVPIAAWPMHSDQPRNAVLITQVLRIGLQVREWMQQEQVVVSARIEEVMNILMGSEEGDEMRQRASRMRDAIKQATMEEGITQKEMNSFIKHVIR